MERLTLPDRYASRLESLLNTAEASLDKQRSPDHTHDSNLLFWSIIGMTRTEYHNAAHCLNQLYREGYEVDELLDRALDLYPRWQKYYWAAERQARMDDPENWRTT